jgi:hypothetical protein
MANFALISGKVVDNVIVAESLEETQQMFSNFEVVEVTDATGPAIITGVYHNGIFKEPIPTKPAYNAVFNEELWVWEIPVENPTA